METKIEINPRGVKIKANTVGFFIANDAEEVRRANTFCKVKAIFKVMVTGTPPKSSKYTKVNLG